MQKKEIIRWLREEDPAALEDLYARANAARQQAVGDEVHLRGLVEVSSHCMRQCLYCGLRAPNTALGRYRMTRDEILACAKAARGFGYGTVVLQAGEDPGLTAEFIADVVREIKKIPAPPAATAANTAAVPPSALAVTLSLGERTDAELALWKQAGADRYLLRFETSNPQLFDRIHPSLPSRQSDRVAQLRRLRELGYEIGSGVMIGIPGQTFDDLANDILLFAELDLDMIGVGPFLPHPQTPLGEMRNAECGVRNDTATRIDTHEHQAAAGAEGNPQTLEQGIPHSAFCTPHLNAGQVPNTELMTYKTIALTRLACPRANIPSTTALATLNKARGRELGLMRGANIVMPNLTPPEYRAMYEIYPAKACIYETADACHGCMLGRIESIGRRAGRGQGSAKGSHKPQATSHEAKTNGDSGERG